MQAEILWQELNLPSFKLPRLQALHDYDKNTLKAKVYENSRGINTHTTIVAFRYGSGVLVAGDRQITSSGRYIFGEYEKVEAFNGIYSIMGMAGMVAYIQDLLQKFEESVDILQRFVKQPIYIDGQAQILSQILKANYRELGLMQYILNYIACPILAGWDPENEKGYIYDFDETGVKLEAINPGYATTGSGGLYAKTVLDDRWSADMNEHDALRLAIRALFRAGQRDAFTSPAQLSPATIYLASKEGIRHLDYENALALAWEVYTEDIERWGDEEADRFNFFLGG